MARDRLTIHVDPAEYVAWPNGGGFKPAHLVVNGETLVSLVRRVELPLALEEHRVRTAKGEDLSGAPGDLAGNYESLSVGATFLPSRTLMGAPYDPGLRLPANDPMLAKSLLLGCPCGITECWALVALIAVEDDRVTWSSFQQIHRDWLYDLGPFVFDRRDYEAALTR